MDGKGRASDNIFIERFWRTFKYEHICLKKYKDGKSHFDGLLEYIKFYIYERKHWSLLYLTTNQVLKEGLPITNNSAILAKI
jgi:putative transposase